MQLLSNDINNSSNDGSEGADIVPLIVKTKKIVNNLHGEK